jgi:AraC-like DNA-binding protein
MNFERHCPRPPLAGFIEYLWHVSDAPAHARERILPNGTLELVFNLDEDEIRIYDDPASQPCRRLSGSVVSGVFGRFFVADTREHACTVGVHFKPGGAYPFLRRVPALELASSHVDLCALWGMKAPQLRERLAAASTVQQRFELLEAALREELASAGRGHRAIPPAIQALSSTTTSVTALAERANLTHRRLIELFGLEVGTTPKLFQRLQRFQHALALARRDEVSASPLGAARAGSALAQMSQMSQLAGYYDQSHWIRECVSFSGLTPTQYSRQWTAQVKDYHVPLVGGVEPSPGIDARR